MTSIYTGENSRGVAVNFAITFYPKDGTNFQELFQHADTTSYFLLNQNVKNILQYQEIIPLLTQKERNLYRKYEIGAMKEKISDLKMNFSSFMIEIMQRVNNMDQVIALLIQYIFHSMKADYVRVYQANKQRNRLKLQYSLGEGNPIFQPSGVVYEESGLTRLKDLFRDGHYQVSNTNQIELLPLKKYYYVQGIQSALLYALYDNDEFIGYVALEDSHKERKWTENENSILDTFSSLLSSYLFKIRDYNTIKKQLTDAKCYDCLTRLKNLEEFLKEVGGIIKNQTEETQFAVVSIDFIHFKYVNELCGREIGDQVLFEYARRLEKFENAVCIARESADCFLLLIQSEDMIEAKKSITRMNEMFVRSQIHKLHGLKLIIVAGISKLTSSDNIVNTLEQARLARKSIKNIYETDSCIYQEEMLLKIKRQLDIISVQENALKNREFKVYLQPKIDLQKNELVGAEVLIRWKRLDGTLMFLDEFIPIFEQNGFIVPIDFYVYETVCKLIQKWQIQLHKSIAISVNVSRAHLSDTHFADEMHQLVKQYQIPSKLLELELTETMVHDKVEDAVRTMNHLQELGFLVSIDDFGAGYSSSNLLKDLKTDILKIDKEFFRRGDLKDQDKIIVSSIIQMAKQLNMKVLSEGVETATQSEFLKESCCDMAQGYLFAKPMPVHEFEQFMMKYSI